MRRVPYEAEGFAFSNQALMEKAVKEAEGIRYVKMKTDMQNPEMVYKLYCQMVGQQVFETPVGYAYLYELQEYLKSNPSIINEEIPGIPVIFPEEYTSKNKSKSENALKSTKTKTKIVRKIKVQNLDYKAWFRTSFFISVVLLLIVIGMFAVTATSDNINILNYENALIEKYENWETKLNEKEERLRERENALNAAAEDTL